MANNPPSAERQVQFLTDIRRLLDAGKFAATYKYALLLSLADLAVENGDDSGGPLNLRVQDLARKFVDYYWIQARPYVATRRAEQALLRQNAGKEAKMLRVLREARDATGGNYLRLQRDAQRWSMLLREVKSLIRTMPLWKLQTIGSESQDFLYANDRRGSEIELRPGVAFCLRRFHDLIGDLVRGAWVRYIRRHNADVLGDGQDLNEFLFGDDRRMLRRVAPVLWEAQGGRCLYTHTPLMKPDDGAIDHFIPWARYPHDFGHNLVLSSGRANGQKSNHLASERHLEAWSARNAEQAEVLADGFTEAGLSFELHRTHCIVEWAYEQSMSAGIPVWDHGSSAEECLSGRWREILASA